jgi:hypothetical protein
MEDGHEPKGNVLETLESPTQAPGAGSASSTAMLTSPAKVCPTLNWGNIEPAASICTRWYKGSEFDVPGDAHDQYLFDQYWPRQNVVASAPVSDKPNPAPMRDQDPVPARN